MVDGKKIDSDFVHLHVHSHYSLLGAVPTPKELAAAAKADGQEALAITDNGALFPPAPLLDALDGGAVARQAMAGRQGSE